MYRVCKQIICPGGRPVKRCEQFCFERKIGQLFLVTDLSAGGAPGVGANQAAFPNECFSLFRIGFILDPIFVPSGHAVESSRPLRVVRSWAKARPDSNLVLLADTGFELIQGVGGADRRRVVFMHGI